MPFWKKKQAVDNSEEEEEEEVQEEGEEEEEEEEAEEAEEEEEGAKEDGEESEGEEPEGSEAEEGEEPEEGDDEGRQRGEEDEEEEEGVEPLEPPPSGPTHPPPHEIQHYGEEVQSPGGTAQEQPAFQYSQCTGKKKALLVGINYKGSSAELRGCINDVKNMKAFIMTHYGYEEENIVVMTEEETDPSKTPLGQNIITGIRWLVDGAETDDALFFHYSGHGGSVPDEDDDEADGNDECICPLDYTDSGILLDDDLHALMVKPLPVGCRLTAIFDSCHSGSVLDLPYMYSTEGKLKDPNIWKDAGKHILESGLAYIKGDKVGALRTMLKGVKTAVGSKISNQLTKTTRTSSADVISFSGCKDNQTSADTVEQGESTGALSWAFRTAIETNAEQSYQELLVSIRALLEGKYDQKPQLSSSHPMDTTILFIA